MVLKPALNLNVCGLLGQLNSSVTGPRSFASLREDERVCSYTPCVRFAVKVSCVGFGFCYSFQ